MVRLIRSKGVGVYFVTQSPMDVPDDVLGQLEAIIREYDAPAGTLEEERAQHVASLRFHALLAEQADNALLGFLIGLIMMVGGGYLLLNGIVVRPNFGIGSRVFGIGGVSITSGSAKGSSGVISANRTTAPITIRPPSASRLRARSFRNAIRS